MALRLGLEAEIGMILAGSGRADFPAQTERLLLGVAATQAAIGLQEAQLLSEQKRVAKELVNGSPKGPESSPLPTKTYEEKLPNAGALMASATCS